jgi:two-component system cell cycle sensor histidine kinase/response regulator CckA
VYGIVSQLGGDLQITSTPGVGTTVVIDLPATDESAVVPPAKVASAGGGTETILLAEDEDDLRDGVARSLRGAGYTVLAAADGPHALALAEGHSEAIHLLLSDVMMPGMLGGELAAKLRAQRPDAKVLFMSGYAGDLMNEQGQLDPGVTVLAKPCTEATLLHGVRAALTAAHRR